MASPHPFPRAGEVDRATAARRDADGGVSDPAVTAAFMAFHREQTPSLFARPGGQRAVGFGGWIFIGLALCGFGGGLFLASVSFNNPETTSIVAAARPPEMIYLPPEHSAERAVAVNHSASRAEVVVTNAEDRASTEKMVPEQLREASTLAGLDTWSVISLSGNAFPDASANFNVAMRHSAAGYSLENASTDGIESAYAGVELPSVPEPAAAPIVCCGLALLVGLTHLKRRRS